MNMKLVTIGMIFLGLVVTLLPVAFYIQAGGDSMMRVGVAVFPGCIGFCGGYLYYKNFVVVDPLDPDWRKNR